MIELKKSPVRFDPEAHQYFLDDKELKGVTSTLIRRAFPDKYKDIDPDVLANAARKGKELHEAIEYYDNFGMTESDDPRIANYERLKSEHGLTTIANEYLVSDCLNYASSIDLVLQDGNGQICIADIKTTYTLDRESVELQLSIYKRFFERQNPDVKVSHLFAIWLPNKDYSLSELARLKPYDDEVIDALIEADLADRPFDLVAQTYGDLPVALRSAEDEVIRIETEMKQMKARQDELKRGLYDLMEQHDIKSFASDKLQLTRVLPTTSETFDSKRFSEEHPELYKQYVKTTNRAGSLKITIKKQQ